jgi:DNA polymerase I-like protein with 3'-5' exonuclease and polymerase domains
MTIAFDLEWQHGIIDTLGLAFDGGTRAIATPRTAKTMWEFLQVLRKADVVVTQNGISADLRKLHEEGIDITWLEPKTVDTRLMMHAINSHLAGTGSFDLRNISLLYGERQGKRFLADWKDYLGDINRTCAYDAAATLWAYQNLDAQVKRENLQSTVDISHRCEKIFTRMREQGTRLDKDVLTQLHNLRKVKLEETIERFHLWEERGKKVIKKVPIWRSNKLLDVCEARYGFRPANRQRATFVKLAADDSITGEAKKFVQAIVELGQGGNDAVWAGKVTEETDGELSFGKLDENGFIYPRYDIAGSPDRAIASGPNVQNPPRVKDDPREIPLRTAFVPLQPDHVILCADFGSLETYTNAIESNDWDRVKAIQIGKLSHKGTQALINKSFNLSLDYTQGKACNHAFDKGESPYNLARRLFGTERPSRQQSQQCQQIFKTMLEEYPLTATFRDQLWERSVENPLIVRNKFGRKLSCFSRAKYGDASERYAKHDARKKYWCSCSACAPRRDRWKYAIAFLGRSSGFDVLLRVMARIWEERRLGEFSLPILEVHDELDFSVPRKRVKELARELEKTFREPVPELGGISLPVDAVWGDTWAACK